MATATRRKLPPAKSDNSGIPLPDLSSAALPSDQLKITGRVARIFYQSPDFSAGILETTGLREKISFSGKFAVAENDDVELSGKWGFHPKYGKQFNATGLSQIMPIDMAGLEHYLANDPNFKGIGPSKAHKIAVTFGGKFDEAIRNRPEEVAQCANISLSQVQAIQQSWMDRAEVNILSAWLGSFGLTHRQTVKIVEALGHSAKTILEENPYQLATLLPNVGFIRADEIAQKFGTPKEHPGRIIACFDHVLRQQENDGHCWMEEEELLAEAKKILCLDGLNAKDIISSCLEQAIEQEVVARYDGGSRSVAALPSLMQCELEIITTIMQHAQVSAVATKTKEEYAKWEDVILPSSLNDSQREATENARTYQLSLIVGAAGSGKSYAIAVIDKAFTALDMAVELAAPTGKAAKRMEELCGKEARTIHRLLEYHPKFGWQRCRENPLDADVVILDEISMCDVYLFRRFLDAIDWTKTRVILVGDPNQLPAVGPGHILRDMLSRHILPTVTLQQVMRQAGVLKEHCTAILRGEMHGTAEGEVGVLRPWYCFNDCRDEHTVLQYLEAIMLDKLPAMGVDNISDVHVLTPMNKGNLGTRVLNILLQRIIQKQRFDRDIPEVPEKRRPPLYPGDKIMQVRNNYDLDLMNGTIGVVTDIKTERVDAKKFDTKEFIYFDFDGRAVRLAKDSDEMNDIVLSYATTVHKAQGSEFPVVIAIMHRSQSYMLNRNLLYTAMTRSRKSAIILGDASGIKTAITKRDASNRRTFLSLVDLHEFSTKGLVTE